jgi:toxin ParE1/3/4
VPRPEIAVEITVGAEHDLAGIYRRRLAQRGPDGEDGAEALLDKLVAGLNGLADFPERGPIPPELDALGIDIYRQLSLPPYRVIYLLGESAAGFKRVTVMIVADSRRDFRTLLEERLLSAPARRT